MRKIKLIFIVVLVLISGRSIAKASDINTYKITMKQDLFCLMMAYPEYIKDLQCTEDGRVYIIMKSGRKILYDDKKAKGHEEKLANPDIQDMMEQIYPLSPISKIMNTNFDPGRARIYGILTEIYGQSKSQVEAKLKQVKVGYGYYQFNGENRAAEALKASMNEVMALIQKKPSINSFAFPCSGTFNYRYIAGTNRLSPHAFGIAIDLVRDSRDYWKWASKEQGQKRLESYPKELVEIFEKNGFVWGGKWNHFDILHFEYRPEIILKSRYFGSGEKNSGKWYDTLPIEDENVKRNIEKIDSTVLLIGNNKLIIE
ncbi:M15 family metallopeptidase [Desnuesiella massiliensis]|uniref:M15 family metallopeptidase n=1 Tax=Desnuesiella massiliensis TaxID=1650662 RepID=UPI0006E15653|nr:M15 family metallopeptidase [Desnuesiella massiliensis]